MLVLVQGDADAKQGYSPQTGARPDVGTSAPVPVPAEGTPLRARSGNSADNPSPRKKKSALKIGFAEHSYAAANPEAFWRDIKELRVSTIRWDLHWDRIAPVRPKRPCRHTDPAYRWEETDTFIRGAAAAGLDREVMFTVWRTPPWASSLKSSRGRIQEMPKLGEWECFIEAATRRYNGRYKTPGSSTPLPRVFFWEAWNEPNGKFAFMPQRVGKKNVSMRNYTRLLNTMYRVVKKNHGRSSLVVGGSLYKQGKGGSVHPFTFMRGMKANRARFDVLSIHPYNAIHRRGLQDGKKTRNPSHITVGNIEVFIRTANRTFGKRYPIWVTEWGWQTDAYGDKPYGISDQQQARLVEQSIAKLAGQSQVKRAMWFLMRDDPPCTRPCQTPWTTGVVTYDDKRKPSFAAWLKARKKLR